MEGFGVWLWSSNLELADIALLRTHANNLGSRWPIASMKKADYEVALKAALPEDSRDQAVRSLTGLWRIYELEQSASGQRPRSSFWTTLTGNFAAVAVAVPGLILIVLFLYGFSESFLNSLSRTESARGLLTYLFGITTVGIAIIIVLGVFLGTGTKEDLGERFQRGKDVLTVLIGVFGAILGFYFGSNPNSGGNRQGPTAEILSRAARPTGTGDAFLEHISISQSTLADGLGTRTFTKNGNNCASSIDPGH